MAEVTRLQMPELRNVAGGALGNFPNGIHWPDSAVIREARVQNRDKMKSDPDRFYRFSVPDGRVFDVSYRDARAVTGS